MNPSLTHVVSWGQRLLKDVLSPGDVAIDLTAGNGCDTLMLAQTVGPSGRVLAFDLQLQAIENSRLRLKQQGVQVSQLESPVTPLPLGVSLVLGDHAAVGDWCPMNPRAIIANLGYCPGGNKDIVTRPDTTLSALQMGCNILAPGGRIVVVAYPGHSGGQVEANAVDGFFSKLDGNKFEVLRLQVVGRPGSPFLLSAGKFN